MWADSMSRISSLFEGHSSVLYLDFVEEVASILGQSNVKVGKSTGEIQIDDQKWQTESFYMVKYQC